MLSAQAPFFTPHGQWLGFAQGRILRRSKLMDGPFVDAPQAKREEVSLEVEVGRHELR